jgi:hypothetical protein
MREQVKKMGCGREKETKGKKKKLTQAGKQVGRQADRQGG